MATMKAVRLHAFGGPDVRVHAGAGGVGRFAIQFAKARDAAVLTTAGTVRPTVSKSFALAAAGAAQRSLEADHPRGKVVLVVAA